MTATKGSLNEVKKQFLALVEIAEPAVHAFGNWRLGLESIYNPKTGPKLPVVTLRISPARVIPQHYSRLWSSTELGDVGLYHFSAHCFASACTAEGEEKYKHAHDLADTIMQYFTKQNWNAGIHVDHAIADVFDMTARESEPKRGAKKTCRVIVEGMMLVKRVD